jgi:hypothetical protein
LQHSEELPFKYILPPLKHIFLPFFINVVALRTVADFFKRETPAA